MQGGMGNYEDYKITVDWNRRLGPIEADALLDFVGFCPRTLPRLDLDRGEQTLIANRTLLARAMVKSLTSAKPLPRLKNRNKSSTDQHHFTTPSRDPLTGLVECVEALIQQGEGPYQSALWRLYPRIKGVRRLEAFTPMKSGRIAHQQWLFETGVQTPVGMTTALILGQNARPFTHWERDDLGMTRVHVIEGNMHYEWFNVPEGLEMNRNHSRMSWCTQRTHCMDDQHSATLIDFDEGFNTKVELLIAWNHDRIPTKIVQIRGREYDRNRGFNPQIDVEETLPLEADVEE